MVSARSTTETQRHVSIFAQLAGRYPKTVAAFSSMAAGEQALRAVAELESKWISLNSAGVQGTPLLSVPYATKLPRCARENSYDVIIAGGGLGLLAGAALAVRGLRVLVFDRDRVGVAHREWNISEREFSALVHQGTFKREELARVVAARYKRGLISFDPAQTGVQACPLELHGVLDLALDAQSVLDLARARFAQAGGTILEGRAFRRLYTARFGQVRSVFEVQGPHGTEHYACRLAIDTMGSVSPIALALSGGLPFDGVCPTAGTIVEGLEHDPSTGDVLVSVSGVEDGRQLIWEGFPGVEGETTVYAFYYDGTGPQRANEQSLLALFEKYFTLLPSYRPTTPAFRHLKPLFGYIPAKFGRAARTSARGLLCLGDAAAGQSPLTFCGFGSFVRHLGRTAALIDFALRHNLLEEEHLRHIGPHQPNLRVAWVFSRFMQPWPGSDPAAVNRLMNVFCRALDDLGPEATLRFLQDRYTFSDYLKIMITTARHYPAVFPITARTLGTRGLLKWCGDMAAFGFDGAMRMAFGKIGARRWKRIERAAVHWRPALALRMTGRRSLWQATR